MFYKNLTEAVTNVTNFSIDDAVTAGNFSAYFKNSKELMTIKTVEKEKIHYLSELFRINSLIFNKVESSIPGIYISELSSLHDDFFDDEDNIDNEMDEVESALAYVSDYYGSETFFNTKLNDAEKMPEDIFADWFDNNGIKMVKTHNDYYIAIEEAFHIIKLMPEVDIFIDVHLDQFMRIPSNDRSGKLLLIDAVIFGDNRTHIF